MRREEVVERKALERRHEDGEDQPESAEEAGDPPAGRWIAAEDECVGQREERDEQHGLGVEAPRVRIHAATLIVRGRSLVAKRGVSIPVTGVRFPPPALKSAVRCPRYVFRNENT